MNAQQTLVVVEGLTVTIANGRKIVDDVSFTIRAGEILGVVGQSGSGKTTVGMSLLGYTRHGARVSAGSIRVDGHDIRSLSPDERRNVRAQVVSYVPQDPRASLNPALSIGKQIEEVLEFGDEPKSRAARRAAVATALQDVGLPSDDAFLRRFPHQLSGGQLQRVGIAMAIVAQPPIIILDEPTTGLDVTTQSTILALVRRLCSQHGIAGLYVTHDLAVVADIADNVLVLNHGRIVEQGTVADVFNTPRDEYTKRLLAAAPDLADTGRPTSTTGEPTSSQSVLTVRGLSAGYRNRPVLTDVSFDVGAGECVALVGESGSGKSTLSRALIGLHPDYSGDVTWNGSRLAPRARRRNRTEVKDLQYIFQSPFTSLNPRSTVGDSIAFAHSLAFPRERSGRRAAVDEAIARVGLPTAIARELPNRLSGGERQRVAIARALVTRPRVLICDEVTSALDVLVQASIVDLLRTLLDEDGLAMLFVTHNLALVRSFADRVLVLDRGVIVESGSTADVLDRPQAAYTRGLLDHTLSISTALAQRERLTSNAN